MKISALYVAMATCLWLSLPAARAEEWPQFRGPTGLGYSTSKNLPLKWDGKSGEGVLWKTPLDAEGHASPIVWGDRIFVCSGDISEQIAWTIGQVPEAIGSPIIVGDYVYRLHTPGILKCWKLADGKEAYARRLDGLSSTWSSPLADAAGRLYLCSGGKSYVLSAGPEGEILAVNDLGDPNHATPAVWGDRLIIVGQKQVYCVGKR